MKYEHCVRNPALSLQRETKNGEGMKNDKDIRVNLYRVKGDAAPFVLVDYMDKDAQEHTGVMLLDSGCMGNILSNEMAECIGPLCKIEEEGTKLYSIAHEVMEAENVNFSFALGGTQFHEKFCITPKEMPIRIKGIQVVGILGLRFMQKHGLVIDYSDFSCHTSDVNPQNLSISDCDFFFPMEPGLKGYGLPVVAFTQGNKDIVVLADTGATNNMIAEPTIVENNFSCMRTNEKDVMDGITGSVEVEEAIVKFTLLSVTENDVKEISCHSNFYLSPDYIFVPSKDYCNGDIEGLPPVEALIGSPFMARQGWVLDFGAEIIYKRRTEQVLKEAV